MNAAARVINQTTLFSGQLANLEFSKMLGLFMGLIFALLLSGLGIIYSTNTLSQYVFSATTIAFANASITITMGPIIARTSKFSNTWQGFAVGI